MNTVKMLALGCTALTLTGGLAAAQETCGSHVVKAGDNLRYIARDVYGDADLYRMIFEANVDLIGPKADHIEIGMTLRLPCAEGQTGGDQTAATDQTPARPPPAEATVLPASADAPPPPPKPLPKRRGCRCGSSP